MSEVRALIQQLVDAGVDPVEAGEVVARAAVLGAKDASKDEAAERRRQRDRDYQRERRQNRQTSADSADIADAPKRGPQTPKKNTLSSPPKGGSGSLIDQLFELQPPKHRRSTRPDIRKALEPALKRGADPNQMLAACRAYYAHPDRQADDGQFAKGVHRLLEHDRWRDYRPTPPLEPQAITEPSWLSRIDHWRQTGQWRGPGPPPDQPDCLVPPSLLNGHRPAA